MIIGKKGAEVDKLTKELEDLTHRHIEVKTIEVNRPEVDPQLVAESIGEQLAKRSSFRRTMKKHIDQTMEAGAKGIKVLMAGRLGGSEMARSEGGMAGSIPLSTLRAKVEYGFTEAKTAQGNIGVKVWINNGDYLDPEPVQDNNIQPRGRGRGPRRLSDKEYDHAVDAEASEVPQECRAACCAATPIAATRSATAISACNRWKAAG